MPRARDSHADEALPADYTARRAERLAIETNTNLHRRNLYNVDVKVCDVSTSGFQAECAEPVLIGSFVSLDVPGIGLVQAQVRWQLGSRMGGQFVDPIHLGKCRWVAERLGASS